jgi:hypothetical protein
MIDGRDDDRDRGPATVPGRAATISSKNTEIVQGVARDQAMPGRDRSSFRIADVMSYVMLKTTGF